MAKATEDIKRAEEKQKLEPAPAPVPIPKGETANAAPDARAEPPISKQPSPAIVDEKRHVAVKAAEEKRKVEEEKAVQAEDKRKVEAEKGKRSSP